MPLAMHTFTGKRSRERISASIIVGLAGIRIVRKKAGRRSAHEFTGRPSGWG